MLGLWRTSTGVKSHSPALTDDLQRAFPAVFPRCQQGVRTRSRFAILERWPLTKYMALSRGPQARRAAASSDAMPNTTLKFLQEPSTAKIFTASHATYRKPYKSGLTKLVRTERDDLHGSRPPQSTALSTSERVAAGTIALVEHGGGQPPRPPYDNCTTIRAETAGKRGRQRKATLRGNA